MDVSRSLGFSPQAVQLLGQAATEPDKYDWDTAAAHAQTPNDPHGRPILSTDLAKKACLQHMESLAAQLRQQLNQNNFGNSLYLIGYAVHTIQDFAAHAGMTNADHSFLSREGHNPDATPEHIQRARVWTNEFFSQLKRSLGACEWERLKVFTVRHNQTDHWRDLPAAESRREVDFGDYGKYEALVADFKKLPAPERSVRWLPVEPVHAAMINAFCDSAMDRGQDKGRLFEGEWSAKWSDGRNTTIDIKRLQSGAFSYQKIGSSRIWKMIGSGNVLQGVLPQEKDPKDEIPDAVWIQASSQLHLYLKLILSEENGCKIQITFEQDVLRLQMLRPGDGSAPRPTGKFLIVPKAPEGTDTGTMTLLKD